MLQTNKAESWIQTLKSTLMRLFFPSQITERYTEYLSGFLPHKREWVPTLHLITSKMGEYASASTPQPCEGRNDLEISKYFFKLQFNVNPFKCCKMYVASKLSPDALLHKCRAWPPSQEPALLALCWSAIYSHFNPTEIKSLKTKVNKIKFHPFLDQTARPWSRVELVPTLH